MDIDLYVISAVLVALTMLTLVVGYARVLLTAHSAAFQIAFSTCLVFFAFAARAWFWDIGPLVYIDFNDWAYPKVGSINLFFNLMAVWGAMHGHYALYLMLPAEDKKKLRWNILTAWVYPPWLFFHEVDLILERIKRRRS